VTEAIRQRLLVTRAVENRPFFFSRRAKKKGLFAPWAVRASRGPGLPSQEGFVTLFVA
jgi:hypothetical protein